MRRHHARLSPCAPIVPRRRGWETACSCDSSQGSKCELRFAVVGWQRMSASDDQPVELQFTAHAAKRRIAKAAGKLRMQQLCQQVPHWLWGSFRRSLKVIDWGLGSCFSGKGSLALAHLVMGDSWQPIVRLTTWHGKWIIARRLLQIVPAMSWKLLRMWTCHEAFKSYSWAGHQPEVALKLKIHKAFIACNCDESWTWKIDSGKIRYQVVGGWACQCHSSIAGWRNPWRLCNSYQPISPETSMLCLLLNCPNEPQALSIPKSRGKGRAAKRPESTAGRMLHNVQ